MSEREGDFIITFTGRRFWPFDPRPEEISILDIAHSLANQCRFTGHTRQNYTVAEHSVWVSKICPPRSALAGLLHDASEAYFGDWSTPVKSHPAMAEMRLYDSNLQSMIYDRFRARHSCPGAVKVCDQAMLGAEARDQMPDEECWEQWIKRASDICVRAPMDHATAKHAFFTRFAELFDFP